MMEEPDPEAEEPGFMERFQLQFKEKRKKVENRIRAYQQNPNEMRDDVEDAKQRFLQLRVPPQLIRTYVALVAFLLEQARKSKVRIKHSESVKNVIEWAKKKSHGCKPLLKSLENIEDRVQSVEELSDNENAVIRRNLPNPDNRDYTFHDVVDFLSNYLMRALFYLKGQNIIAIQQILVSLFILWLVRRRFQRIKGLQSIVTAVAFSRLLREIKAKNIKKVEYHSDGKIRATLGKKLTIWQATMVPGAEESFFKAVEEHVTDFTVIETQPKILPRVLQMAMPFIFLGVWYRVLKSLIDKKEDYSPNGKQHNKQRVYLKNVILPESVKQELREIVDASNNPKKYKHARPFRGVLLTGPSGTGKTMVAKAIACEADAQFVSCCASELIEVFVGRGAARVRSIFEHARSFKKAVLFFDEIDAIGSRSGGRASLMGGGNDETVQTVNQLLFELDGFGSSAGEDGVMLLGATNRYDSLDQALLRPGRFDRQIFLGLPDFSQRLEILKNSLRGHRLILASHERIEDLCLDDYMLNFSGADVVHVTTEAIYISMRNPIGTQSKNTGGTGGNPSAATSLATTPNVMGGPRTMVDSGPAMLSVPNVDLRSATPIKNDPTAGNFAATALSQFGQNPTPNVPSSTLQIEEIDDDANKKWQESGKLTLGKDKSKAMMRISLRKVSGEDETSFRTPRSRTPRLTPRNMEEESGAFPSKPVSQNTTAEQPNGLTCAGPTPVLNNDSNEAVSKGVLNANVTTPEQEVILSDIDSDSDKEPFELVKMYNQLWKAKSKSTSKSSSKSNAKDGHKGSPIQYNDLLQAVERTRQQVRRRSSAASSKNQFTNLFQQFGV